MQKIGRPRRFSPSFLLSERDKLKKYRQTIRSVQFGSSPPSLRDFPYQVNYLFIYNFLMIELIY